VDPIRLTSTLGKLGVGKLEEDERYTSNIKRKELETEREQDTDSSRLREAKVVKERQITEEIKEATKSFYCKLCNKQYNKAMEYETHLVSYDHHHKKRFQDMKQMSKLQGVAYSQKKKEEQKEQQEINKRIQAANAAAAARQQTPSDAQVALPLPTVENTESAVLPDPELPPSPPPPTSSPFSSPMPAVAPGFKLSFGTQTKKKK